MASQTKIEWTEMTWNPVTGCTKVSAGCKNCYAERLAIRLKAMGVERYQNAFGVTLQEDLVDLPLRWRKRRLVFVNSMSDLFHEAVPLEFIQRVFDTMQQCPQHQFQILTKRSRRLYKIASQLPWAKNVWMGVSVENEEVISRIFDLQTVPASVRFLSCEPLLGPLDHLPLDRINWVIVGGESGPGARKMEPVWVESIYQQCREANIPFFFKQWGGTRKNRTGRELLGRTFSEMPTLSE
jgi:protein gp37